MADHSPTQAPSSSFAHPLDLEIQEFDSYALIIDARSPHEFVEDYVPLAINLPVVDDTEYAEVGTRHKNDPHRAYLIGVEYSLRNIARHIAPLISRFGPEERMLVYCFRGGKRSKLWADNLRTIGFSVDVLKGGWKSYRRWVRASLETIPTRFNLRVLSGSTGSGKTRLLGALEKIGEQVLDLEDLAAHRGSLLGAIPGRPQPTQKFFDTLLLDKLRRFDPERPVWLEDESKRVGNVQLPQSLYDAMHRSCPIYLTSPLPERVRIWREDYPHFANNPVGMVALLEPLKPLVGGEELAGWRELAAEGRVDELFQRVMIRHYDPAYERSMRRSYERMDRAAPVELGSLTPESLQSKALELVQHLSKN